MKIIFSVIFLFAQSQESWKTIYKEFSGLNWNIGLSLINMVMVIHLPNVGIQSYLEGIMFSELIHKFLPILHYNLIILYEYHQIYGIDSWDGEIVKMVFDSEIKEKSFILTDGKQICGTIHEIFLEYNIPITFHLTKHNSQSLIIIMTSTLDQPVDDESWGFQNLIIEILECPIGCVFCTDQISKCNFWINSASYWNNQINSEGWQINGSQQLTISQCVQMWIAGGINILNAGSSIDKNIGSLPGHFKVQILVKLWTIGEWQNQQFSLEIDDQLQYSIPIIDDNFVYSQCQQQKVKITNIDVSQFHSSHEIKLQMKTEVNNLAYWGVQSFELFVAKCSINCLECTGELQSQCIACVKGWKLIDIGCIVPPLECSQIRIIVSYKQKVDFINSFKIQINELYQNIGNIGQNTLIIDEVISSISFQIQVKCEEKMIIKSFFRNCDQCDEDQQKFINQCPNQSNVLNYHATFLQIIKYQKELIITISQSKLEISQVFSTDEAKRQFVILKIEF